MIPALTAALVRIVTGCRLREPIELPPGACVFIANHTSNLDGLVVWSCLPPKIRARCCIAAAKDYWGAGPVRRMIAHSFLHLILIDRTGITRHNNPLDKLTRALRSGRHLIIFPEGTRNEREGIGPFRPGIHHIARQLPGVTFVPVYLENLNRIAPKGEFLVVPLMGRIRVGPAFRMVEGEGKQEFLDRARRAVQGLAGT